MQPDLMNCPVESYCRNLSSHLIDALWTSGRLFGHLLVRCLLVACELSWQPLICRLSYSCLSHCREARSSSSSGWSSANDTRWPSIADFA